MLNAKEIGKRIQELRKAKGLTQEEMAEKLEMILLLNRYMLEAYIMKRYN